MKHRRGIVFGMSALLLTLIAALHTGLSTAHRPSHVAYATRDGLVLKSFFEGVEPNATLQARLNRKAAQNKCRGSEGITDKIASVLGLTLTVYAQSYCTSDSCGEHECSTTVQALSCGSPCPTGQYTVTQYTTDTMSTFFYPGVLGCQNTTGCGCVETACVSEDCGS